MTATMRRPSSVGEQAVRARKRGTASNFGLGTFPGYFASPHIFVEGGPSIAGRVVALSSRMTIRPIMLLGSCVPHRAWPCGLVDFACRIRPQVPNSIRFAVKLPHTTAQLVRAHGVLPGSGDRRVVLYLHGGAFLVGGANSHRKVVTALSIFADAPILVANYRLLPKHSVGMALEDCHDAYQWLRAQGYEPDQIVLAGDSAGGYLAMSLAQRLQLDGEKPAALVLISPFLEIVRGRISPHPNTKTDAMFPSRVFDSLLRVVVGAAANRSADGEPDELYEPLEHIKPGLPPTLIHVSGSETLLHDAHRAAAKLAAVGVPVGMRVWPGQIHDFQVTAPMVPEATRSLRQIGEYIRNVTGEAV